jgi:hypothetical protein
MDNEAVLAFGLDPAGNPRRNVHLYDRLDYLDSYCAAANRAMGAKPPKNPGLTWWERSWLGRLLRWPTVRN